MRKITIVDADRVEIVDNYQMMVKHVVAEGGDMMDASDGSHTFTELYEHRYELYIALCNALTQKEIDRPYVWRSKNHSDGTPAFDGTWFVLGIGEKAGEQITYHLPMKYWQECDFATTLDKAPEWDGHTAKDVIERLKNI